MKKSLVVLALALALGTGSAAQAQVQDYVMCPGDVLQVVVYGHEDLSTLAGNTQNSPYVVLPADWRCGCYGQDGDAVP